MILPPDQKPDGTWKEPANVDCYMLPVLQDLQRLGPRPSDFVSDVIGRPTQCFLEREVRSNSCGPTQADVQIGFF